jgi:hypothetical protein
MSLIDRVDQNYLEVLEGIKEGAMMVNDRLSLKIVEIQKKKDYIVV